MFLIDTDVLSELRKRTRNPCVVSWISSQASADLFLSAVSVGEIERGIVQQRRKNKEFAEALVTWLDKLITLYEGRILPVDLAICRRWGRLSAEIGHDGTDLMIAATAIEHGLSVVTRNTKHFAPTGVSVINPFLPQGDTP